MENTELFYQIIGILNLYLPGFWVFIGLFFLHIILSSVVHVKNKTFDFDKWPNHITQFIKFIMFIFIANSLMLVARTRLQNNFMIDSMLGLQAAVYFQAIAYYLNNLVKSCNKLGWSTSKDLSEIIEGLYGSFKNRVIR